jgi:hypothetical protein
MGRERTVSRVFLDEVFPELLAECLRLRSRKGRKWTLRTYEQLRTTTGHDYGLDGAGYKLLIRIRSDLITGKYALQFYDTPFPLFWVGEGRPDGYLFTSNHDLGSRWMIEQLVSDNRNRLHNVMLACRSGEELEAPRRDHYRLVHGMCGKMVAGGQALMDSMDIGQKNSEVAGELLLWTGKHRNPPDAP